MTKHEEGAVPHKALVLIADGRKAIIARNEGSALKPQLEVRATFGASRNAPNHELGADRPGRFRKDGARRSAAESPDRHQLAEEAFLRKAGHRFALAVEADPENTAVVVAPPAALAVLRETLIGQAERIVTEIAKDLTRHPLSDIEAALAVQ